MFRYCFITKPLYLMRTIRPDLMTTFVDHLQQLQRSVLGSIFQCEVSNDLFNFCCLRISSGGLGIHRADEVCPSAYTASYIAFFRAQGFEDRMLHLTNLPPNSLLSPRMDQLRLMVNRFKLADDDPPIPLMTGHDFAKAGLNQDPACS